jgi:hypothetical protein
MDPLANAKRRALSEISPTADEACARHHCPQEGVEAPDLATVKGVFSLLHRYELLQDRGEPHGRFD